MSKDLTDLIDSLEPALAVAFMAAITLLRTGINYAALLDALRRGDIDAALDALNIDRGAFGQYVLERQAAFSRAGTAAAETLTKDRIGFFKEAKGPEGRKPGRTPPTGRAPGGLADPVPAPRTTDLPAPAAPAPPGSGSPPAPPPPLTLPAPGGGQIVFRFDMTNPRAENLIRTEAAARVAGYVEEQIETARRVIADGYQRGEGPDAIATTIAGRVNPISGRREGGIIGLSDPQVGYVESMRARLLSGDPDEMVKVLGSFGKDGKWKPGTGMTLRDRRFDRSIMKAIRDVAAGKPNPLTRDRIDEMTAKYADRLLSRRAEDIARTETAQGVEMARAEATRQALDKAGLPGEAATKAWYHQGGIEHARDQHLVMHGRTVTGIDTHFVLPDGTLMLHPHDPAGGVKHNANCRCRGDREIDWAWGL